MILVAYTTHPAATPLPAGAITDGTWAAWCLPNGSPVPDGVQAFYGLADARAANAALPWHRLDLSPQDLREAPADPLLFVDHHDAGT
jgi:hypothetical protein